MKNISGTTHQQRGHDWLTPVAHSMGDRKAIDYLFLITQYNSHAKDRIIGERVTFLIEATLRHSAFYRPCPMIMLQIPIVITPINAVQAPRGFLPRVL